MYLLLHSDNLPRVHLSKVYQVPRHVVKTKILSMNINPVVSRVQEVEYPRYKRTPIKHSNRNISLPPIK